MSSFLVLHCVECEELAEALRDGRCHVPDPVISAVRFSRHDGAVVCLQHEHERDAAALCESLDQLTVPETVQ